MSATQTLPQGWAWTTIGTIAEFNPRHDLTALSDTSPVSFVPMAAVEAGTGRMDPSEQRPLGSVRRGYTSFREEDVLFAKITPCMENGKSAVARGLTSGIGFGSTEFHVLRSTPAVDADYLYYYASQERFRQAARANMTGTAGQMRVPNSFMREATFPLAPLAEQRRIVAAIEEQFTRLDAGVAALKSARARLKQYRAAVLKAAVEGELTKEWREAHPDTEPATELMTRILAERRKRWEAGLRAKGKDPTKSRYGEPNAPDDAGLAILPLSWTWASLEQCTRRITDGTHQPPAFVDAGVPFVFVQHIVGGKITFTNTRFISEATFRELNGRCPVERGDILYTAVGSYGVAVSVTDEPPFSFQRHIAHIKPIKLLSQAYLVHFLNSPLGKAQAHAVARGVAQKTVTLGELTKFVVAIPPQQEQEKIATEIERRVSVLDVLEASVETGLRRAERLRQSILTEAFAGRLVPQDPNDEPASAFLDRIGDARSATTPGVQSRAVSLVEGKPRIIADNKPLV